jgi:hypothetical protein
MSKVTFTLYPDEYDLLMDNIKGNGYKKQIPFCVRNLSKKEQYGGNLSEVGIFTSRASNGRSPGEKTDSA